MPNQPILLPVPEWLPDLPDYQSPGTSFVKNVYPRSPTSYGPVGSPSVYSNALSNKCQGASAFIDPSGNVSLFAGDISKLYHLVSGGTTWADISKGGGYACPDDGQWKFEYYNGIVLATDFADPIQAFTIGSSSAFADLAGTPPKAKYMAFVRGFLMLGYTFDGDSGTQPQRVWWSGAGDPTAWPTPGSITAAQKQSSYNDIFGTQGAITGLVGNLGNADAAVFFQHAVWRVTYSGPPDVFDFFPAEGVRGCPAPNSIVQYGNLCYYLGEDGFYVFDGNSSTPIGANKFDKTFYADVNPSLLHSVIGTVDPINKQIIWAYPSTSASDGVPDTLLIYNWQLQRASTVEVTCEMIARVLSIGYTLDELYTVLGYSLDTLPAPLDSSVWLGGQVLLGLFDQHHKLNYLTGPNLAAIVETSEVQPIPGRRARVNNARAIVDGGVPFVNIGHRERIVDDVVFSGQSQMNALGTSPGRSSGRYIRARIRLGKGAVFSNISGVEIEATDAGTR